MNEKIEKMYQEAHELISKAKALLESGKQLTDAQRQEVDAWLSQAEEIEKKAKQMQAVLEREAALAAQAEAAKLEQEKKDREERAKQAKFKAFHEYMIAIYRARELSERDARLDALDVKALAAEVGISGGFLIPPDQQTTILTARAEASIVRPRARVIPMGSRLVPWPTVDYSQGAAGKSAFFGGVSTYWMDENVNIPASQPKFKQIELHARELAGYCEIPNGLLRDSPVSLDAFLSGPGSFGGALAWQEDYDFIRASGNTRPLGIMNAGSTLFVTRNAANDFKLVDAVTMVSKMIMTGGRPVWLMNQSVIPKLYQMVNGTIPVWIVNVSGEAPTVLLGYPIIFTEKCPALGTAGDVILADFSMYLVGDRQAMALDISRDFKFQANQTAFRAVEAIDGQPWLNAAIILADGSTQVSPFVYLN